MGSAGIQNPLSPYDSYRDCSSGICSIYCTQFCYLIIPPPPPSDDSSGNPFSPLIISIIGILAGVFLLVSYYTILTKFCKTARGNDNHRRRSSSDGDITENEWSVGPAGMDSSLIGKITVCKYKKGDGLIEGTDCAVCLSEFREAESLRLLPKCSHAFHLPCIDTWLKSQSSCPLCRTNVAVAVAVTVSDSQALAAVDVSAHEINRVDDDLVVLVEDGGTEQMVVGSGNDEEEDQEGVEGFRRSVSFDTFASTRRRLSISDILMWEDTDEYVRVEIDGLRRSVGSSEGDGNDRCEHGKLLMSPVELKRSVSAGRFIGRVLEKGNTSVIQN